MDASPPDLVPPTPGMRPTQAVDHKKNQCSEIKGVPPGCVYIYSPPLNAKIVQS